MYVYVHVNVYVYIQCLTFKTLYVHGRVGELIAYRHKIFSGSFFD